MRSGRCCISPSTFASPFVSTVALGAANRRPGLCDLRCPVLNQVYPIPACWQCEGAGWARLDGEPVGRDGAGCRSPRIDHASAQCEEPPLQTIREGLRDGRSLGAGQFSCRSSRLCGRQLSSAQEMLKGAMNLIDEDRAEALYVARVDPRVISGGSAANTIVGVT